MEFRFTDAKLERLYTKGIGARRYPDDVVNAFLRRVRAIEAADDERDLRLPASVHFEKLKGRYAGKNSMKLKGRWRLILRISSTEGRQVVLIDEMTKHYGD